MTPVKLIIADDHKIVREGLISLVKDRPELSVVGEATDGATAVELTRKLRPDIVLMDITMAGMNGIAATREIVDKCPECKVIILSMNSDKRFVSTAFSAGASAYLVKDEAFEELARAIRFVREGKTYLSPSITGTVVNDLKNSGSATVVEDEAKLTIKELEVLQMLAEGKGSKEIGYALGISSKTVDTHRQKIMHKLELRSIAELTKYAVREGLTTL